MALSTVMNTTCPASAAASSSPHWYARADRWAYRWLPGASGAHISCAPCVAVAAPAAASSAASVASRCAGRTVKPSRLSTPASTLKPRSAARSRPRSAASRFTAARGGAAAGGGGAASAVVAATSAGVTAASACAGATSAAAGCLAAAPADAAPPLRLPPYAASSARPALEVRSCRRLCARRSASMPSSASCSRPACTAAAAPLPNMRSACAAARGTRQAGI